MNSNRILLITSEFPPQPGGIGTHSCELAKALTRQGKEVCVLTDYRSADGKEEAKFDKELPYEVVRIKRHRLIITTYLKRIRLARKLSKSYNVILVSGKFSLFILHWIQPKRSRKKWIAILHGSELLLPSREQRKWVNGALTKANDVIAVSKYTASLVENLSIKNVHIIPNGYSLPVHSKPVSKKFFQSPLKLVTVGNLTLRKGQHNVIEALPSLQTRFPDIEYHMIGVPTEMERLERLAESLGVRDAVHFHGRVNEKDKIELTQTCSVFIMLSERTPAGDVEGFGIAILEANALGLPAVGGKGSGVEDAIRPGVSGELVSLGNHVELEQTLERILHNYENYSKGALEWVEHFTWDKIVKQYLSVIEL